MAKMCLADCKKVFVDGMYKFSEFQKEHFDEYRQWYLDEELNRQLGPAPDQEWLEYVLADKTGHQYVVEKNNILTAVVGVVFPTSDCSASVVSDLAVSPFHRRQGVGAAVLRQLIDHELDFPAWTAFVSLHNPSARNLLVELGWQLVSDSKNADELLEFCWSRR